VPPQAIVTEALEFPAQYFLENRWIGTDTAYLKSGLTISSTGVAGYAWAMDNNGLYYTPAGAQPCHWFFLIGYELDETQPNGVKWIIFDSYENYAETPLSYHKQPTEPNKIFWLYRE